jgi:type IV pilus assembly protein PilV
MRSVTSLLRARGMSLVECLVALVVLAIGMLGMASLILEGLRTAHLALLRTQAVNLVSDMMERIRANPSAGRAYECASYAAGPSERGCARTDVISGASCTPAELAEDDLARWQSTVRSVLPVESVDLCAANVAYTEAGAADAPSQYRVSVSWQQRDEPAPLAYESDLLLVPSP